MSTCRRTIQAQTWKNHLFGSLHQCKSAGYTTFCVHLFSLTNFFEKIDNDTFAFINTQPSNMQGEHWIMIANFRHELYFADSLGHKGYSFLKQHYKQIMPAPLQYHPSVCGFYTIYAAFHLFKFRQEEITGVHDVNVLSFISSFM